MNKLIAPVAGLALAALFAVSSAHAVSCTQQAAKCRSWAAGQGPQAASYAANAAANGLHRASVEAMRSIWARRPTLLPRLPLGDQRRFGYRIATA